MEFKTKVGLNNPLPYIFSAFIVSSLCYEMYARNKLLATLVVSSFFLFIFFYKKAVVTLIIFLFFIVAFINTHLFFNYIPASISEIRIEKIQAYEIIGRVQGRLIRLDLDKNNLVEGERILAKGEFVQDVNLSKGIIGEYRIRQYKTLNDDFISLLQKRRDKIYKDIDAKLGSRKAGLITSVAFGYSKSLDNEDRNDMKSLGVSHAVAVSGLHMALIFGIINKLLGVKLSLIITFIFMLFSGAAASSVRAYIMIFIMSFAIVFRKSYNSMASLSLAGIIILLIKPYDIFSLGFLLSFLATAGIILFNKKLNKAFYKIPDCIRGSVAIAISAQILTFPILLLVFNEFSLNFILGNILMLPLLNILVVLGNVLLLVNPFNNLFNYFLYITHYCIKLIDKLQQFTMAVQLETLYLNYTIAYFYLGLLITFYFYKKGYKKFIYYPLITFIYISVLLYNPIPNIKYYKEGALLISVKGQRVLLQTKAVVDKQKLKAITMAKDIYKDFKEVKIGDRYSINKSGKNYIFAVGDKEYLLMVNFEKRYDEYDIIDFRNDDLQEVWVFNDRIIARE